MIIKENYSLREHNTFNLDVRTRYFVEYETEEDLQKLLSDEYFFSQTFWHIGQGSNLLFLNNYAGIIVHSAIRDKEVIAEDDDHIYLKVGAGHDWDSLVAYTVSQGWGGLENLSLIPGEVGASAYQNIGAYGVEAADHIDRVEAYYLKTGEKVSFSNADCKYAYRHSFFKEAENKGLYYITYVVYKLNKTPEYKLDYGNLRASLAGEEVTLESVRQAVIRIRKEKLPDPKELGNAGSFFMNPYVSIEEFRRLQEEYPEIPHYPIDETRVKVPAAWLIDTAGLKGKSRGGAAVHRAQPLVIVNQGKATGEEIAALAGEIQAAVREKFGISLTPEVNYI